MQNSESPAEPLSFRGSVRAGSFTAQLFVELTVTPTMLEISAMGRSFRIERTNFEGLEETSILGLFKRGLRFRHCQPNQPETIVFYPSLIGTPFARQSMNLDGREDVLSQTLSRWNSVDMTLRFPANSHRLERGAWLQIDNAFMPFMRRTASGVYNGNLNSPSAATADVRWATCWRATCWRVTFWLVWISNS